MARSFFDFLQRSKEQGDVLSFEARGIGEASKAARWAECSASVFTEPESDARYFIRVFSATLLIGAIALSGVIAAANAFVPWLDRTLRPETYEPAKMVIEQARAIGFSGAAPTLGSSSLLDVRDNALHQRNPQAHPDLGVNSFAIRDSLYLHLGDREIAVRSDSCSIRLGANRQIALLSDPKASLRFTALHEMSHCDAMGDNWAAFTPSPEQLSTEEARALRLIVLADSQVNDSKLDTLSAALNPQDELSQEHAQRWLQLGAKLFRESVADARTALILSRLEPATWRASAAEIWLERAAGAHGAIGVTPHNHATEEAIAMVLSTPDERLAQLSPQELDQLAARVASDAVVIKMSKQGWHERYAPAEAALALNAALEPLTDIPDSSPRWEKGELRALGLSPERLREDRAWAASPAGAQAMTRLLGSMRSIHDQGQQSKVVAASVGDSRVAYAIAPSLGGLDLRYEGVAERSWEAALLVSAALLERAKQLGGASGFKTPQTEQWRRVDQAAQGNYKALVQQISSPSFMQSRSGKVTRIAYSPKDGLFKLAESPQELARLEGRDPPKMPQLNWANRAVAKNKPASAKPSVSGS